MDINKGKRLREEWGDKPCNHPNFEKETQGVCRRRDHPDGENRTEGSLQQSSGYGHHCLARCDRLLQRGGPVRRYRLIPAGQAAEAP